MASVATVLQSQQLAKVIFAYQRGIHADMRPLLRAYDPLTVTFLKRGVMGDNRHIMEKLFASLHAAITAWYSEWGHTRIFKLFACAPQMQLRVIAHALWSGNLSVLTLLPVESLRAVPSDVVSFAALQGNKSVLQYLHEVVGLVVSTPRGMFNAAQYGHLDVIRYLFQLNNDTNVRWAAEEAARYGHLEVIEFFHVHCASCDLANVFTSAIGCQHLVEAELILNLVGKDNLNGPNPALSAAVHGHVRSLEWLRQRGFACSTEAMDIAARCGHLDAVQWLHANRSEGCTESAMHYAAVNGHLNVVEWLFSNRHEGCTTTTLEKTIQNGHWQVVRFLAARDLGTDDAHGALRIAKIWRAPPAVVALLESAASSSNDRQ